MDVDIMNKVKRWVECDNVVVQGQEKVERFADERKNLERDILDHVQGKNISDLSLAISDGYIKFQKRHVSQSLSVKLLRAMLNDFKTESSSTPLPVDEICDHVTTSLSKREVVTMKRVINDIS
jgi:hypothetical protein